MGFTQARRYFNYQGSIKYDKNNDYKSMPRSTEDPEKAEAASVFYEAQQKAEADIQYSEWKSRWKEKYG